MTAQELFGVIVRAIGLLFFLGGALAFFLNPIIGGLYVLVGLGVIAGANWIVEQCYSPRWSLPRRLTRRTTGEV